MVDAFDTETTNIMAKALGGTLERLKALGLIDGDASEASPRISRSILQAVNSGIQDTESLILYAIGRFQAGPSNQAE